MPGGGHHLNLDGTAHASRGQSPLDHHPNPHHLHHHPHAAESNSERLLPRGAPHAPKPGNPYVAAAAVDSAAAAAKHAAKHVAYTDEYTHFHPRAVAAPRHHEHNHRQNHYHHDSEDDEEKYEPDFATRTDIWHRCCLWLGCSSAITDLDQRRMWLRKVFKHLDFNRNGYLTFDEFTGIEEHLDQQSLAEAAQLFAAADSAGQHALDEVTFVENFVNSPWCRQLTLREVKFWCKTVLQLRRHTDAELAQAGVAKRAKWYHGDSKATVRSRKVLHHHAGDGVRLRPAEKMALRQMEDLERAKHRAAHINDSTSIETQLAERKMMHVQLAQQFQRHTMHHKDSNKHPNPHLHIHQIQHSEHSSEL